MPEGVILTSCIEMLRKVVCGQKAMIGYSFCVLKQNFNLKTICIFETARKFLRCQVFLQLLCYSLISGIQLFVWLQRSE